MRTVLRELPAGRPTVALIATADDEAALGTGEVAIRRSRKRRAPTWMFVTRSGLLP